MMKKLAVVTGASKGIGLAIARKLEEDGYSVIGTYVQSYDKDFIETLETENIRLIQLDVSDFAACTRFAKQVLDEYQGLALLVNNAGIVKDNLLLMMSEEDFKQVMDVNLGGAFNMVKAFSKSMLRQREGAIINVSSVIGEIGNVGQANYAASKAGLIGFSKSIAKEFAPRNIRVNCVAPGFITTDMTQKLSDEMKADILSQIALKRFGEAADVAEAVSFLASEKARYITGQVLNVCGGMLI